MGFEDEVVEEGCQEGAWGGHSVIVGSVAFPSRSLAEVKTPKPVFD